jgi:hypothetical protein
VVHQSGLVPEDPQVVLPVVLQVVLPQDQWDLPDQQVQCQINLDLHSLCLKGLNIHQVLPMVIFLHNSNPVVLQVVYLVVHLDLLDLKHLNNLPCPWVLPLCRSNLSSHP